MLAQQIRELQTDEGYRLRVYDDATGQEIGPGSVVTGHPTIGYGRALDAVHGLTAEEVDYLFSNDLLEVEDALLRLAWFALLDPIRRGVMVNLAYNMGVNELCMFTHMIAAMQAKDWKTAADQLQTSEWAGQVQKSRRDRLLLQLQTGQLGPTVLV